MRETHSKVGKGSWEGYEREKFIKSNDAINWQL
jgi:hypothetical protein